MALSTYTKNKVIDHLNGKTSYTMPTIYVAVSSTTPAADGSNVTEPSGGAYARVATSGATWNAASSGSATNASTITFTAASADWVSGSNLTYAVLYDASTSGNMIGYGALSVAKDILNGDVLSVPAGSLSVSLT